MDRSSKQNINKDIVQLSHTVDQMDLTDIYKNFHPKEAKYTFFQMHMEHFPFFYFLYLIFFYYGSITVHMEYFQR